MSKIIQFQNVSFAYKKNETEYGPLLLDSINFSIEEHALVFLFGESGAGKSSLLRLVNGLEFPTSGEVLFRDKNLQTFEPCALRRKICLLQQVPVMFPGTVEENLDISPGAADISRDEKKKILELLGLNNNSLNKTAAELSVGQAQRVAFSRCLMNRPEILLLDEPTASLDQKNKLKLFDTIINYTRESKMTILWITHDPSLAEKYSFKKFHLKDKNIYTIAP